MEKSVKRKKDRILNLNCNKNQSESKNKEDYYMLPFLLLVNFYTFVHVKKKITSFYEYIIAYPLKNNYYYLSPNFVFSKNPNFKMP